MKVEQSINNDQSMYPVGSHCVNGMVSVRDNQNLEGNNDSNNNRHDVRNVNCEETNQQEDSEIINIGNKVRVNSLSALIEHIKMENAKAKGEPYIPPKLVVEDKKIENVEEKKKVEVGEEEIVARCPTPLQPGSYWYSKQFSNKPDQELPNSSSQEVREVLASLTSKTTENKAITTEPNATEVINVEKSEEVSVEEGSEISQSYSTDTLAETSDDKVKTVDGSSTLEDIGLAENDKLQTNGDEENSDKRQEDKDNEIIPKEGKKSSTDNETGIEKITESEIEKLEEISEKQDEIIAAETGNEMNAAVTDNENTAGMEIKPNEFIKEEPDEDVIAEIGDHLTEISPCGFIKNDERKVHSSNECVANDCMCYEAIFRQDHPLETSSLKSDTSFGTDSPAVSPKKQPRKRHGSHSTSSLSDGSMNSPTRPSPRRCRIAAKFESPLS